ncbi:Protochlorophyllide-dependent translocon component 52, chloroplastic [Linum grandiflorum]
MEALTTTSAILPSPVLRTNFSKPSYSNLYYTKSNSSKFKLFSSSSVSLDNHHNHAPLQVDHVDDEITSEKFDWYSQWYPVVPECDLDKRVPHGKKVMGIDVVVWWDVKQSSWKVFDDMCPHRLAPLSEGRIDASGRLQCVYHGWCFDGSGDCKLIPQAPADGPPVHTNKRACVAAYPTVVQYGIVWFWPNSDPQYKDIFEKKKPPFVSELDDPSFTVVLGARDLPYGYEVLVENLMDPAHIPYSHCGLVPHQPPIEKRDREGGRPLEYNLKEERIDGFDAEVEYGLSKFIAPCIGSIPGFIDDGPEKKFRKRTAFIFICVPVSPGKSRLIWAFPRNYSKWIDKVVPRWFFHLNHNLVLDSDLNLLYVEEQRIMEAGGNRNWYRACFVPAKSDALVVGFRRWLNHYGGGEVDWKGKYSTRTPTDLPPTLPPEQLMDRYWTHVVNCSSCSRAYKNLKALESFLVALSVGSIAIAAATKEAMSRTRLSIMAMICFAASRWLARYIDTNFRYHDYNHSFPPPTPFARFSKLIGVGL